MVSKLETTKHPKKASLERTEYSIPLESLLTLLPCAPKLSQGQLLLGSVALACHMPVFSGTYKWPQLSFRAHGSKVRRLPEGMEHLFKWGRDSAMHWIQPMGCHFAAANLEQGSEPRIYSWGFENQIMMIWDYL